MTRLDGGAGRIEAGVVHHEGLVLDHEVDEVGGMRVLSPQRCALEAGSLGSPEAALVLLNSAVTSRPLLREPGRTQFDLMAHWPHVRHLHVPVRMCTDKAESVGETRGVWLFWTQHLPAPTLQHEVYDSTGRLIGRTDYAWPKCQDSASSTERSSTAVCSSLTRIPARWCSTRSAARTSCARSRTPGWSALSGSDFEQPGQVAARIRRRLLARAG